MQRIASVAINIYQLVFHSQHFNLIIQEASFLSSWGVFVEFSLDNGHFAFSLILQHEMQYSHWCISTRKFFSWNTISCKIKELKTRITAAKKYTWNQNDFNYEIVQLLVIFGLMHVKVLEQLIWVFADGRGHCWHECLKEK